MLVNRVSIKTGGCSQLKNKIRKRQMRCYLRGTSLLGLFNSVVGCLFNRVLVKRVDRVTKQIVGWFWAKAADFPHSE